MTSVSPFDNFCFGELPGCLRLSEQADEALLALSFFPSAATSILWQRAVDTDASVSRLGLPNSLT